jgi:ubiquinone/menaquinone biosynthesis C-methylase UbiE
VVYIALAVIVVVLILSIIASRRVEIPRRVSPEGIEDNEVVEAYDRINRWPQFRALRRMFVTELKRHSPEGVLVDVGCGPGQLIAGIARSLPHLSIIGVDIAEEMLQKAGNNLASMGLAEKVSFRRGDMQGLPLESDSIDFVVSTLSLHHWSQPKQAIEEIHRVLKPGGQFLIFDLRRDSPRAAYWIVRFAQSFILPAALGRINEPTGSFMASYTPAEVKATMSDTPFHKWRVKPGLFWTFNWGEKD